MPRVERSRPTPSFGACLLVAILAAAALGAAPPAGAESDAPGSEPRTIETASLAIRAVPIATALDRPWSMAFLPDGSMLVSEEAGRLFRVSKDGSRSAPLAGLPSIYTRGNGGLFDIKLAPGFASTGHIYFAFAEPAGDGSGRAGTSVARAVLHEDRVSDVEIVFRQEPKVKDERNFGGRLLFATDGKLFVTLGDRFAHELVQDRGNTIGALVRIQPDGRAPQDNPFVGDPTARPEIWSYGHRNIEGAALHPETGELWIHEFGPDGGDELNIIAPGRNYGWPEVSWGRHYSGEDIPDPPTRPDLAPSLYHWNPVISPSGMSFYTGDLMPEWRGNLLIGGLSSHRLVRLTLRGDRVISEERIDLGARIRDVVQGPEGAVYLLTDQPRGEILRLTPGREVRDRRGFEESVPE